MPKVSIIVTAYNIENYIRQCLDSVLTQTLQDIEIIVVDDGSKDETPNIIKEYAQKDNRISSILFEKNTIGGVATAANAGIDVATGDFIGFADGDDIYDSTMFERLYESAVTHSADLAMCDYYLLDESDGQLKEPADAERWSRYPDITGIDLDDTTRRELLRFVSVPWRKIYRRDLIEEFNIRFPVGDYFFEDNPFHWATTLAGKRVAMVPEKLCHHRVARAGQTMATVDSRLLRIFEHHNNIRDWLKLNNFDDAYRIDLLRWTANQLSWVSERAEGALQQELYDILTSLIDQYENSVIEEFGELNGKGRTYVMLKALKAEDFTAFINAAQSNARPNIVKPATMTTGPSSLMKSGLFHLKNSGIRETARITKNYFSLKLGSRLKKPSRNRTSYNSQEFSNDEIMAALVVLQKDIRNLRADITSVNYSDRK